MIYEIGIKAYGNNYDGAIANYNKSISIDPKNGHYVVSRALAENSHDDTKSALADFNKRSCYHHVLKFSYIEIVSNELKYK